MFSIFRRRVAHGLSLNTTCDMGELRRMEDIENRRLRLYGEILPMNVVASFSMGISVCSDLAQQIMEYNEEDYGKDVKDRKPVWLFIDSPGGDPTEGYKLIDAINLSKTPIFTVNVGQCSSMAFLIMIAGHERLSLPLSTFLMHDGSLMVCGTTNKVRDLIHFEDKIEEERIKPYILNHSIMTEEEYNRIYYKEYYMTAKDALKLGFIDKIIDDIEIFMK